ncbi:hypothetical protein IWW48_004323 [Coemansia sp. RSA 1200]|nr:hypothetical protein IWW48_004323 [Coemansia sp. RSA 1200]
MSGQSSKTTNPNSRFISADAIEEARKEREAAWKRAYDKSDDSGGGSQDGGPPQDYDPRTLFERLQEQKRRKTEAYEESRRFANQIRKLDTDEIEFLDTVQDAEDRKHADARRDDAEQLARFKDDLMAVHDAATRSTGGSSVRKRPAAPMLQSQKSSSISRRPPFSLQGIVELRKPVSAESSAADAGSAKDRDPEHSLDKNSSGSVVPNDADNDGPATGAQDPLGLLTSYASSGSDGEGSGDDGGDDDK